ncbi:MAG: hypothetical protein EHM45_09165 [Desulfobacteraceae bacterium]|nr:MAG: hypothetical protein EHM45_09165 [Desulfobacteraceae bacterium]
MYSWGADTRDWKNPKSYSFDSARKPYLDGLAALSKAKGGRVYETHAEADLHFVDPHAKTIQSQSQNVIIVAVDVTGSMAQWPAAIFDRLPLFYQTLGQYRPDLEICFAAIGDAHCDAFPLQVNSFAKGLELEACLQALGCEGGGGGQISESYELFAYFMDQHCRLPRAIDPFLIIYGDEKFYEKIDPRQIRHYIGDAIEDPLKAETVWKNLLQKFNLFYLQKSYGDGDETVTAAVSRYWSKTLGPQRVIRLPSCERAVDVALGMVAKQWGRFDDFKSNISARQDESQIRIVQQAIESVPPVA